MRKTLYFLFLIAVIFACRDQDKETVTTTEPKINVNFALTDNEECKITRIDILAFKVDQNDTSIESFAYRTKGYDIKDGGSFDNKKFSVGLLRDSEKYRFVIIANAKEHIDNLGDLSILNSKDAILSQLAVSNNQQWIADSSNPSYKDVPMWGESSQLNVTGSLKTININLTRMLARLDVVVGTSVQDKFKLKSIRVYNYNTSGLIAPITDAVHWDGTNVLQPSLPVNSGNTRGPLVYDQFSETDISSIRQIYLFEALATNSSDLSNATCIVVGGEYNNEGIETFYRLDIANVDGNGKATYLDLLRNHLYNIRITKVEQRGYQTPDEAVDALSANITADIFVWTEGGLSDIVYDGQYMLGVSKSKFTFPMDQKDNTSIDNYLTITTDYPTGWKIDKIVDINGDFATVNWLTANLYVGAGNAKTTVRLLADKNISFESRTAYIHISAGRLQYVIEVTQTIDPEAILMITDASGNEIDGLTFLSHVGGSVPGQQLKISWLPSNIPITIITSTVNGYEDFEFGSGDVISSEKISNVGGNLVYNIQPPPFTQSEVDANSVLEKLVQVDFIVENGGELLEKTIFLRQKNYGAEPNIDANFLMDGSGQYFYINANADWHLDIYSDPQNVIKNLITTNGGIYGDRRDEKVSFITQNNMENLSVPESEVTFRLSSTNPSKLFPDKLFKVKLYAGEIWPLANCYNFPTSTVLAKNYLIPVEQANRAIPGSIGENDKLDAYFVWTDEASHVNNIPMAPVGRGSNGYLYVKAGTPQGNTVAAIMVDGEIKWSWHLWVVNDNLNATTKSLNGYTLMDRNIGALNSLAGNYYATGTFYQWGRKDPFPPSRGISSATNERIYNRSGEITSIPTSSAPASLQFSIQNPLTYLVTASSWRGSATTYSWNGADGGKTPFDPCPPGWRVPPPNLYSTLTSSNFSWNGTNRGRTHSTAGWFPASGVRSATSSNLNTVGAKGGYWNNTYGSPYVTAFDFTSSLVRNNLSYNFSDGASVRCIKE